MFIEGFLFNSYSGLQLCVRKRVMLIGFKNKDTHDIWPPIKSSTRLGSSRTQAFAPLFPSVSAWQLHLWAGSYHGCKMAAAIQAS